MDLKELENAVIEFRDARHWGQYHNPKDLAISLSLEAAELLEIFQWKDPQEIEEIRRDAAAAQRVKEEIGDILIYALNMCQAFGVDPSEVILSKLEINEKEYPIEKAKGSAKKYNET